MKILVIEDDRELLKQLCGWLEENGYQTLSAKNEREAEDVLSNNSNSINIAIVDMYIPSKERGLDYRESGLRLIQLMKKKHPFIMSIVYTGNADVENASKCMEAGAFNYVEKGKDPDLFLQVVKRAEEKLHKDRYLNEALGNFRIDLRKAGDLINNILGEIQRIQDEYDTTQK